MSRFAFDVRRGGPAPAPPHTLALANSLPQAETIAFNAFSDRMYVRVISAYVPKVFPRSSFKVLSSLRSRLDDPHFGLCGHRKDGIISIKRSHFTYYVCYNFTLYFLFGQKVCQLFVRRVLNVRCKHPYKIRSQT